jgi:hypothetical protein
VKKKKTINKTKNQNIPGVIAGDRGVGAKNRTRIK